MSVCISILLYYEKIICYYLGRIRPSDMRNRFNSIRYKESDSVSWYTSSLIFCCIFNLIGITRTLYFCIFVVSFWSEKVGSGQKFLSKLWFLYFWIEKKW